MKFKAGDRVRVYGVNGVHTGEVSFVADNNQSLTVLSDGVHCSNDYHPKQCRRLIKRPIRRVWVHPRILIYPSRALVGCPLSDDPVDGFIEFREVRAPQK